jgi:hypothetical protein
MKKFKKKTEVERFEGHQSKMIIIDWCTHDQKKGRRQKKNHESKKGHQSKMIIIDWCTHNDQKKEEGRRRTMSQKKVTSQK